MFAFSIKVTGAAELNATIKRIMASIEANIGEGLTESLYMLRDDAILKLQGKLGTGRWGRWGHTPGHKAISDKNSWTVHRRGSTHASLSCDSEHSAAVEYGSIGKGYTVYTRGAGAGLWPIGQKSPSKGQIVYRPYFSLQPGYAYLRSALNDSNTQNKIVNALAENIRKSIFKVV